MIAVRLSGVSVAAARVTPPVLVRVLAMKVAVPVVPAAAVEIVVAPVMSLGIIIIGTVVRAVGIEPEIFPVPKPRTAVLPAVAIIPIMVASVTARDGTQVRAIVQWKFDRIVNRNDRSCLVGGMGKSIGIG